MKQQSRMVNFSFDEMVSLRLKDPVAFERRRKELIEQAIVSLGPDYERRMQQYQWKIDGVLRKHSKK